MGKIIKINREIGINGLFVCPCCGYATLEEFASYEICEICFWEDDGQDDPEADITWGGPNRISLTEGRINFLNYGVSDLKDKKHVRPPNVEDINIRHYRLNEGIFKRS